MSDWFAENAPSAPAGPPPTGDWFAENAPAATDGYWGRVKKNLPESVKRFVQNQPGPTSQPAVDPNGPKQTLRNPITGKSVEVTKAPPIDPVKELSDAASAVGNIVAHPVESFANDPVGTVGLPLQIARGGYKGATSDAAKAIPKVAKAIPKIAKGAVEGAVNAEGVRAGAIKGAMTGGVLGNFVGEGKLGAEIGGAVGGGIPAVRGAVKGGIQAYKKIPREPGPRMGPEPAWKGLPTAEAEQFGEVGPLPAPALPSGRVPGKPTMPPPGEVAPPAPPAVSPDLLDQVAQGMSGKSFAKLSPKDQVAVRNVAEKLNVPGSTPPKAIAPGVPTEPPESAYPRPDEPIVGAGAMKEQYQRAARTVKGRALARYLSIGGIPYEDAVRMGPEHWQMAAKDAGVSVPSELSIKVALDELKKLELSKKSGMPAPQLPQAMPPPQ